MAAKHAYDADLFQDSTMTFGEHLEELRSCLIRALAGLMVGFVIGLLFGNWVVEYIQLPLEEALQDFYLKKTRERIQAMEGGLDAYEATLLEEGFFAESWEMDLPKLRQGLRTLFPQDLLPALPGSPVRAQDVLRPSSFAGRLATAAEESSGAHQFLWKKLRPEQRSKIRQIAEGKERFTTAESQKRALAEILNELAQRETLSQTDDFSPDSLPASVRELWERRETLDLTERADLNRWLLTTAFPLDLGPPRLALVPLRLWRRVAEDPRTSSKALAFTEPFMIYMKASLLAGAVISGPWVFYQIWMFVAAGLYPHEKHYVKIYGPMSLGLFLGGSLLAFFVVFEYVLRFLLGFNDWLGIDTEPRINEWLSFALLLPLGFGISFQLPLVMLFLERIGIFTMKAYVEKWRLAVLFIFVLSAVLTPAEPTSMVMMAFPLCCLYAGGILLCRFMPRGGAPAVEE